MLKEIGIDKTNNFDLIRLLAALQVMICHAMSNLDIQINPILGFIYYFPGVPIFFTISGFLLANSLRRNPDLKGYFISRCLRIFPGLWGCFIVTIIFLVMEGAIDYTALGTLPFYEWIFCQVTIFQFYTPPILRTFPTPNGSLWTIGVEFQFYILLPVILRLRKPSSRKTSILAVVGVYLISVAVSYWYRHTNQQILFAKLIHVSVLPYLQFFLMGVFAFLFWPSIKKLLVNKFLVWFSIYLVYTYLFFSKFRLFDFSYTPNFMGWIGFVILSLMILSLAFTKNELSHKILKGTDISYGIYLYHMVVINYITRDHIQNSRLLTTVLITVIFATLSWKFIEAPFLKAKNRLALYRGSSDKPQADLESLKCDYKNS